MNAFFRELFAAIGLATVIVRAADGWSRGMSCKIHGRTCSGDHASDVPPSRDGISLRSRAHTLTAARCYQIVQSQDRAFELDFAAIRVGIALYPGMSPLEVRDQLMRMCRMIEREFGIEIDTNQATTKSHTRYGAQKG